MGTRGLKGAVVTIELSGASGRSTVITDRGKSRRPKEERRGTDGRFALVRDGRSILLMVEKLPAPATQVAVTTSRGGAARSAVVSGRADAEFDKLLEELPVLEEEGELGEELADARESRDEAEDRLDRAERDADKTIDRIHRAQRDLIDAKSDVRAREAREELERQKKKLDELNELRKRLRAKFKLFTRWVAVLRAARNGLTVRQCNDGGDNSDPEDTLADHPADPGCVDPADNDEKDVQIPLACPAQGSSVSSYAVINTPQSNSFESFSLRLFATNLEVLKAAVTGTSSPSTPLPGEICGSGVDVTYQYVVYTDGTPFSLEDAPPGDHAICVFIEADNPAGSGNPGGQDASLRLAAGTAAS